MPTPVTGCLCLWLLACACDCLQALPVPLNACLCVCDWLPVLKPGGWFQWLVAYTCDWLPVPVNRIRILSESYQKSYHKSYQIYCPCDWLPVPCCPACTQSQAQATSHRHRQPASPYGCGPISFPEVAYKSVRVLCWDNYGTVPELSGPGHEISDTVPNRSRN